MASQILYRGGAVQFLRSTPWQNDKITHLQYHLNNIMSTVQRLTKMQNVCIPCRVKQGTSRQRLNIGSVMGGNWRHIILMAI